MCFCRFSIITAILICTANITNSFLLKWGFNEEQIKDNKNYGYSLIGMINKSAPKPFVFRSTSIHMMSNILQEVPQETREKIYLSIKKSDSLRMHYFPSISNTNWTQDISII